VALTLREFAYQAVLLRTPGHDRTEAACDATGRRVVEAWRILAAGASIPQSVGAQRDPAAAERASELAAILAIEATNEDNA
jgi:hypothetical protein